MNKSKMMTLVIAVVLVSSSIGGFVYNKNQNDKKTTENAATIKADEATTMKAKEEAVATKTNEEAAMVKDNVDAAMVKTDEVMAKDEIVMMKKGTGYITLADYNSNKDAYKDSKKVLFFAASWCPSCQALTKDIEARTSSIPSDTVVIRADYDKETSLKQTYGVTYQHTLVQIDNDGQQLTKWNGGNTIETISAKTI
jgi:thiol-disulfide isomerase/thioredoxin